MNLSTARGFAALLSALILSIVLFLVSVSANFAAYLNRINTTMMVEHTAAQARANSCIEIALFTYARDFNLPVVPSSIWLNASTTCTSKSFAYVGTTVSTVSEAVFGNTLALTRAKAKIVNTPEELIQIISWDEGDL